MQQSQLRDQTAVGLLRERVKQVVGAQAGLHVANGNLLVEGGQGGGEGGGGVSLNQHQIRGMLGELLLQPLQRRAGDVGEGLPWGHQSQITIRRQAEEIHHLGDHLAVLTGEHHPGAEALRLLEGLDHRRQLDGLGTRAEHDRDVVGSAHAFGGCSVRPDLSVDPRQGGRKALTSRAFPAKLGQR